MHSRAAVHRCLRRQSSTPDTQSTAAPETLRPLWHGFLQKYYSFTGSAATGRGPSHRWADCEVTPDSASVANHLCRQLRAQRIARCCIVAGPLSTILQVSVMLIYLRWVNNNDAVTDTLAHDLRDSDAGRAIQAGCFAAQWFRESRTISRRSIATKDFPSWIYTVPIE